MSELQTRTSSFRQQIYELMADLPVDKVTTYGDLAAFCGHPDAARIVGGIAHFGPTGLPWHRLVNSRGGLARGFPGGREVQEQLLLADGIECENFFVKDFEAIRWRPKI